MKNNKIVSPFSPGTTHLLKPPIKVKPKPRNLHKPVLDSKDSTERIHYLEDAKTGTSTARNSRSSSNGLLGNDKCVLINGPYYTGLVYPQCIFR